MEDLKNKDLIKLMWLPGEEDILFQMRNEMPLPHEKKLYSYILNYIDIVCKQLKV